jgi:hypothetical protein
MRHGYTGRTGTDTGRIVVRWYALLRDRLLLGCAAARLSRCEYSVAQSRVWLPSSWFARSSGPARAARGSSLASHSSDSQARSTPSDPSKLLLLIHPLGFRDPAPRLTHSYRCRLSVFPLPQISVALRPLPEATTGPLDDRLLYHGASLKKLSEEDNASAAHYSRGSADGADGRSPC